MKMLLIGVSGFFHFSLNVCVFLRLGAKKIIVGV